jgi:hypothetical protein
LQGADFARRIIKRKSVYGLDFKSADAAFFHQPHLTFELCFGHGRAKPPPAHHDAGVVRRIDEGPLQLVYWRAEGESEWREEERNQ